MLLKHLHDPSTTRFRRFQFSLVVAAMLTLCNGAFGSEIDTPAKYLPAAKQGREILQQLMADTSIPGMSVAVAVNGKIVWSEGFGFTDLEKTQPVTPATRFRCGSVSKVLTISAVAKLMETGALDLDAPIQHYVPTYPSEGGKGNITTRLLCGHLAGIRHYKGKDFVGENNIDRRNFSTTDEALVIFKDDPLVSVPGEEYHYSTFAYTLISAAVERASGKDFLAYLQQSTFGPLAMRSTGADYQDRDIPGRTKYYSGSRKIREARPANPSYKWAGGGLVSTAEDLVRFGSAHLGPGYLKAETLEELFTSQTTTAGKKTGVGIGWRIGKDSQDRTLIHHAGSMAGCRALVMGFPETGVAIALLSNLQATPRDIGTVARQIAAPFH